MSQVPESIVARLAAITRLDRELLRRQLDCAEVGAAFKQVEQSLANRGSFVPVYGSAPLKHGSKAAMLWRPDECGSACTLCGTEFSLMRRRHHCRVCGELVCFGCAPPQAIPRQIFVDHVCLRCAVLLQRSRSLMLKE